MKGTPKQKKLIKLLSENVRELGDTKTLKSLLMEAGYKESTAESPSRIIEPIQEELDPIVNEIEKARNRAVKKLADKEEDASYGELIRGIKELTDKHELLTGNPTERKEHDLSEEAKKRLEDY